VRKPVIPASADDAFLPIAAAATASSPADALVLVRGRAISLLASAPYA